VDQQLHFQVFSLSKEFSVKQTSIEDKHAVTP